MGKAPEPPDPYETAQAQLGTNVSAATAASFLNNMTEVTPDGRVDYIRGANETIAGPNGRMNVPTFRRVETLSQPNQNLRSQSLRIDKKSNQIAIDQLDRARRHLSSPISTDGAVDYQRTPNAPNMQTNFGQQTTTRNIGDAGQVQQSLEQGRVSGGDYEAGRQRVENALLDRLGETYGRDRDAFEARMAAQGVQAGSEAYRRGLDEINRGRDNARFQALMAGGQEQSRLAELERANTGFNNQAAMNENTFANQAQAQLFNQMQQRAQFGQQADAFNNQARLTQRDMANRARLQGFEADQAQAAFNNAMRSQQMQEMMNLRNQPINEITALASMSQVNQPTFSAPYRQGIDSPDLMGMVQSNYAQESANANAQMSAITDLASGAMGMAGGMMGGM